MTNRQKYAQHWESLVKRYAQCVTCGHSRHTRGGLAKLTSDGWQFELIGKGLIFRCSDCATPLNAPQRRTA